MKQVYAADTGTPAMQAIALAVREGANAYLRKQFTVVGVLIVVLTAVIIASKWPWTLEPGQHSAAGTAGDCARPRTVAFLMGALLLRRGRFRRHAPGHGGQPPVAGGRARSYGDACSSAYRTGTITGMLTDGLGLLGGTLIFMVYGETAYEVLLGFGFGGTLLALFMRVGGGIYTKAADVGADLVGKVEAGIPEDDPRNAATIADNVGDNVGDCAGMAADIFESYEVTIVAAMILGYASFGHKGVIFPLLVRAIGVVGSIISTYAGRPRHDHQHQRPQCTRSTGLHPRLDLSVVGFLLLGYGLPALRRRLHRRARRSTRGCTRNSTTVPSCSARNSASKARREALRKQVESLRVDSATARTGPPDNHTQAGRVGRSAARRGAGGLAKA